MLTAKDKERIRAEEIFRDEVRRSLPSSPPPTSRERAWQFLNSSFGLWLLSTVLVGTVGFFWGRWEVANQVRLETAERIRELDLEIADRLRRLDTQIRELAASTSEGAASLQAVRRTIREPPSAWANGAGTLVPELRQHNLIALLTSLERFEEGERAEAVRAARECVTEMARSKLNPLNATESGEAFFQRREQFVRRLSNSLTSCVWRARWGGPAG